MSQSRSFHWKDNSIEVVVANMKINEYELCPDILAKSEKNAKDLEKLLLQRALIIKDERIRVLENKLSSITSQLKAVEEMQRNINVGDTKVIVVNNNVYSGFSFCACSSLLLIIGLLKLLKK